MKIRKVIFWLHLVAGVVAGVVIGIMSSTGATLAFEKQIIAWAERDVRRVAPPSAEAKPLPLDDLMAKVREQQPDVRPTGLTIFADPGLAVLVSAGRTHSCHVDPYTGEVRETGAPKIRRFLQAMNDWHRWLGREGDGRAAGKAVTGACNVAFLVLAISGLYLWWPRHWTRSALRAVSLPGLELRGKARDWSWHNATGLWSAPVLIVLTITALPISYRWAGDAVSKLTGGPLPAQAGPGGDSSPSIGVPPPPPGTKRLSYAALLVEAQKQSAAWEQITLRLGGAGPRGGTNEDRGRRREEPDPTRAIGEERRAPQPVTVSIKERGGWPLFASTQLMLDPFTGAVLKQERFSDHDTGRKVRSWMRFLHTGEALGIVGQAVAGLASLGGVVLVWTGFALAIRRVLGWKGRPLADPVA